MESLVEKLDADLEEFIEERIRLSQNKPKYCNYDGKSVDEIAEEMKQHPAFMTEFDETKPLTPAMEALQVLKYESQSNDDNATSFKEDGNKNFERKKYRWAIDNYTAGLDCKPSDLMLQTVLYTNRAAASFHIGNYRSSLNDCIAALKVTPGHKKALIRGLNCYIKLEKHQDIIDWCDNALSVFPTEKVFIEARSKAVQLVKKTERDARQLKIQQKKMRNEKMKIIDAIKSRGIRIYSTDGKERCLTDDEWIAFINEGHNDSTIQLLFDENDKHISTLLWPVLFLYPQHNQSDFIVAFNENSRFVDHLDLMFAEGSSPGWDVEKIYNSSSIQIYFGGKDSNGEDVLFQIDSSLTLSKLFKDTRFKLTSSTPTLFLVIKDSEFEKTFCDTYKKR